MLAVPEEMDLLGWPAARFRAGVIHAKPCGLEICRIYPGALCGRYQPPRLERSGDTEAAAQGGLFAGKLWRRLAASRSPGRDGSVQGRPSRRRCWKEGPHARFVDLCLASSHLERRMPADLRRRASGLVWRWAPELAGLDEEARLVHGDFNGRNLLVRSLAGRWSVVAVLDWEFAVPALRWATWATPALRARRAPSREPHFSAGYLHAGGALPRDWWRLARSWISPPYAKA